MDSNWKDQLTKELFNSGGSTTNWHAVRAILDENSSNGGVDGGEACRWVNQEHDIGSSVMHYAFRRGGCPFEIIQFLHRKWPDVLLHPDRGGNLPLHLALCCATRRTVESSSSSSQQDDVSIITYLIEACPQSVRVRNRYGVLPIHYACSKNHPIQVVECLVKAWPNSLTARYDGNLPIHLACQVRNYSDVAVVQFLAVSYPQSLHQQDGCRKTPLDYAGAGRFRDDTSCTWLEAWAIYRDLLNSPLWIISLKD